MKKLFAVLVMLLAINANAQWVQTYGPLGGDVNCISVIGSNIFVGTKNMGEFRSTDNGSSWSEVFPNSNWINTSAVIDSTIFIGTSNGIYSSINYGSSWENRNNGLTNTNVTVLKVSGTKIFAGTAAGGFVSTNRGLNWESIGNDVSTYVIISYAIKDSIIIAGTYYNGIYRTTNNGLNWVNMNNGVLYNTRIPAVEYSGNTLFAGTYGSGLYSSTNNGEDWNANALDCPFLNKIVVNGGNIYLGTYGYYLYYSSNNGSNWIQSNSSLDTWLIFDIAFSGSTIFAGSYLNGIYRSTNNMTSWSAVGFNKTQINELVADGIYIFAATQGSKIFRTSNNGTNWIPASFGFIGQYTDAIYISGEDMYAGTSIGNLNSSFFISTDKGVNWEAGGLNGMSIRAITATGNSIFVGTSNYGVQFSTNKGINWFARNGGLTNQNINTMSVSGGNVFAGTQGGGVFKTTNNGINWENVSDIYNGFSHSFSTSGTKIAAGTNAGVFLSTNSGDNWSHIGLINETIRSLAIYDSIIIAGTNNGIYYTIDNGNNWIQRNQGLGNVPVYSIIVNNGYVFAGTYSNSVWKRPLSEVVGIQNNSTEVPSKYSLGQNYPNPFNPITNVKFSIVNSGEVNIIVYDVQGREVQTLVNESLKPGTYETSFDGSQFTSGVYFYKLITDGFTETRKMILIK